MRHVFGARVSLKAVLLHGDLRRVCWEPFGCSDGFSSSAGKLVMELPCSRVPRAADDLMVRRLVAGLLGAGLTGDDGLLSTRVGTEAVPQRCEPASPTAALRFDDGRPRWGDV